MDTVDLMWMIVLAYIVTQAVALVNASGRDRILLAIPLIVMVPIFVLAAILFVQEKNLWPIWILLASPLALAYVVIISLLTLGTNQRAA